MGRSWCWISNRRYCERLPGLAGAFLVGLLLALGPPVAVAAGPDARLKQAAQHFADLEDEEARAILENLSAEGLADADVLLGYLYSDPLYAERDYQTAIAYFERAAAYDHPEALFQLAESSYWPGYLDQGPGSHPDIFAGPDERTYDLLHRANPNKHSGAKYRLGLLCIFQSYSCSDDDMELSLNIRGLSGGLGLMNDPFAMLRTQMNEAESFERTRKVMNSFNVGLSFVNPLVVTALGTGWIHTTNRHRCPSVHDPTPVMRLWTMKNGVQREFENSLTLEDCYTPDQQEALESKVQNLLDGIVTLHGTYQVAHINWCFEHNNGRSASACLVNAAFDQYFSCYRLSLQTFLQKFGIDRLSVARFSSCREHLLNVREG